MDEVYMHSPIHFLNFIKAPSSNHRVYNFPLNMQVCFFLFMRIRCMFSSPQMNTLFYNQDPIKKLLVFNKSSLGSLINPHHNFQ